MLIRQEAAMSNKPGKSEEPKKPGGGLRGPDRQQDSLRDSEKGTFGEKTPERLRRDNDPDETIKQAVKDAQHTLTEYVHPGNRNCDETISKLISTLDNPEIAEAILESDIQEQGNGVASGKGGGAKRKPH
jgi:hypothetical protein